MLENHTLHSGTYLYSPYMAVPPPPPGVFGIYCVIYYFGIYCVTLCTCSIAFSLQSARSRCHVKQHLAVLALKKAFRTEIAWWKRKYPILFQLCQGQLSVITAVNSLITSKGCLCMRNVCMVPGGGGTWVFFGWVCAARDSKLAPRYKKNSSWNWYPVLEMGQFFIPRFRIRFKTDTPF